MVIFMKLSERAKKLTTDVPAMFLALKHTATPWYAKIMAAMVKNKSIDYLRKERRGGVVEIDIDDEEVYIQLKSSVHYEPEHAVIANEGYQRIIDTIESLKPIWRDVVKMYFLEDRSYTEISEALGITEDVCRSRISRARKYLEVELKDMLE